MIPHRQSITTLLLTLLTILPLTACNTTQSIPHESVKAQFAEDTYATHVNFLADPKLEGRGPGSDGQYTARDYLIKHFKQAGLQPAFGQSYTQSFEIPATIKATEKSLAVYHNGKTYNGEPSITHNALGFSASDSFKSQPVFLGYGISSESNNHDDYNNIPEEALKDKVLIVFRYEPMKGTQSQWRDKGWTSASHLNVKADFAANAGAKALIIVNPPSHRAAPLRNAGNTRGVSRKLIIYHASTDWLENTLNTIYPNQGKQKVAELQTQANQGPVHLPLPDTTIEGTVKIDRAPVLAYNVAGLLPGRGALANQYVILGAHYDHVGRGLFGSRSGNRNTIHPGADDNASGTSGMLLTAQRFARKYIDDTSAKPRRAILFVGFAAEEMGLIGSRHMVNNLSELGIEKAQIHLMFNMDMIGRLHYNRMSIWGVDSAKGLRDYITNAIKQTDFEVKLTGDGYGPSDQASFYTIGVPVLSFFTGLHKDYHTPTDTAEKITTPQTLKLLNLAYTVLNHLTHQPDQLVFEKAPGRPRGMMGRLLNNSNSPKPFLGVSLAFQKEQSTLTIQQVTEGSPADKAGLKPNDQIIRFNNTKPTDVESIVKVVQQSKPGQTLTFTIKRNNKTLNLNVTLGSQ